MPSNQSELLLPTPLDLSELVQQYDSPDYMAAMLVGSATGNHDTFSDIDLVFFTAQTTPNSYQLSFWQERLVSTTVTTITETMETFSDPLKAIQNIEGLRRAIILRDTTSGALAKIQTAALHFEWTETLTARAEEQASYNLAGNAEEVHKILGALKHDDINTNLKVQGRLLAGLMGLTLAMPIVIALKYRILSQSENHFISQIYDTIGAKSNWFNIYKRCLEGQLTARAMAALELYEATSVLCLPFGDNTEQLTQQKTVIRKTLKRIESCLNRKL